MILLAGCGRDPLPITEIQRSLRGTPDYSIVLEDMKEEGNFFKSHYHKYKVITPDLNRVTTWRKVPDHYFQSTASLLGMSLLGMKGGKPFTAPAPPLYQYVGDSRYGTWRTGPGGQQFWSFRRDFGLYDALAVGLYPPVYRSGYDTYRKNAARHIPFYGVNKEYGTRGSHTQKTRPDFFQRQQTREMLRKTSFGERVSKRIGRTRSSVRGRSGGSGK